MNKRFPYQIHIILGLVWFFIGIFLYTGIESAVWIGGGMVMFVIGLLNRK